MLHPFRDGEAKTRRAGLGCRLSGTVRVAGCRRSGGCCASAVGPVSVPLRPSFSQSSPEVQPVVQEHRTDHDDDRHQIQEFDDVHRPMTGQRGVVMNAASRKPGGRFPRGRPRMSGTSLARWSRADRAQNESRDCGSARTSPPVGRRLTLRRRALSACVVLRRQPDWNGRYAHREDYGLPEKASLPV